MADEMTREQLRERAGIMFDEAEDAHGCRRARGDDALAAIYAEECEVLRYAIAALSAPDASAVSDEELREECGDLGRHLCKYATSLHCYQLANDTWQASLEEGVTTRELASVTAPSERTSLEALHAALTVLAQKGGGDASE